MPGGIASVLRTAYVEGLRFIHEMRDPERRRDPDCQSEPEAIILIIHKASGAVWLDSGVDIERRQTWSRKACLEH